MKSFSQHTNESNEFHPEYGFGLDESVKGYYRSLTKYLKRSISSISKLKKLRPGESSRVHFKIPKPISEAKDKQTGKLGGELAEVALLDKLYQLFAANNVKVKWAKRSYPLWKSQVYNKALKSYRKSEKGNSKKVEDVWIKHGYAGAQHIFQKMRDSMGIETLRSSEVILEHLGVSETGSSKSDFSIRVTKPSEEEIINISLKATESGSPFDTPDNGLQTGWEQFVLSVALGSYSKDRETSYTNISSFEKEMQKYEETKDIKHLERANEKYSKSILGELDRIGEKRGMGTELGKYVRTLTKSFYEISHGGGKKQFSKKVVDKVILNSNEYVDIVKTLLEESMKSKNDKQKIIKGIMKLGGIEDGLDYVSLGLNKNDRATSDAISTLYNPEYKAARDTLTKKTLGKLDARVDLQTAKGGNWLLFTIFNTTTKKDIVSFPIIREINNSRILLPRFDTKDLKQSQYKRDRAESLIKSFGTSVELEKQYIGTTKTQVDGKDKKTHSREYDRKVSNASKKILNFVDSKKIDLMEFPPNLQKEIFMDVMSGTSPWDAIIPHAEEYGMW